MDVTPRHLIAATGMQMKRGRPSALRAAALTSSRICASLSLGNTCSRRSSFASDMARQIAVRPPSTATTAPVT
jgi:hypothetical protein